MTLPSRTIFRIGQALDPLQSVEPPRARLGLRGPASRRRLSTSLEDTMRAGLIALTFTTAALLATSASAERHYDCTKAGNANKAACKSAAAAPAPSALKVSSITEPRYDCSKAGNANKAACKAPAPAPVSNSATSSAPSKAERHYDCSKAGNANKAACKAAPAVTHLPTSAPAGPVTAPVKKPSLLDRLRKATKPSAQRAAPAATPASVPPANAPAATPSRSGKSITTDPAGATGQCKDGTYTHATHHSGACSSHGGVTKWM